MEGNHILLVDDEPLSSRVHAYMIAEAELGHASMCTDSRLAMDMLRKDTYDLVVLDLNMPWVSGQELLEQMLPEFPDIPVLVLTNEDRVETAVECMKHGAFDFLGKPVDRNRFVSALRHALTIRELKKEIDVLARGEGHPLSCPEAFREILTVSPSMQSVFSYIEAIAPSPRAVLITGESGTGKELVARAIHAASGRTGAFVPINVSGLDDSMFSDSLFGHVKGAYTGAEGVRKGLVEEAREGTLFLDEIGDMAPGPQIKLLRLLQEGEYYPLGADRPMKARVRVIAATNADILSGQEKGVFRRDLYYRLISHQIKLPALRERTEDIPVLAEHFVKEAASTLGRETPSVSRELVSLFARYDFPGNIRELQALCFDAVSRSNGPVLDVAVMESIMPISLFRDRRVVVPGQPVHRTPENPEAVANLPDPADSVLEKEYGNRASPTTQNLLDGMEKLFRECGVPRADEVEDLLFRLALEKAGGSQTSAARLLGVSQSTLSRWQKRQGDGS